MRRRLQLKGRARVRGLEEHAEGPAKSLRLEGSDEGGGLGGWGRRL